MTVQKTMFVLASKVTGGYVRIGEGGYPSELIHPFEATTWDFDQPQHIANYTKMFPQYELVEVKIEYSNVRVYDVEQQISTKLVIR
jgi:hypothetical protein